MAKTRRKKWRLYQFLVACGVIKSKSQAAKLAHSGKITVNGKVMESLHYQIHPFKDDIRVSGNKLTMKENRRYFVLNKPRGVETTKESILKFLQGIVVPADIHSYAPVGRLDRDTTGLIIITNDGRIGKRVLDPKTKRVKVYVALVQGNMTDNDAARLSAGVIIEVEGEKYQTEPAAVEFHEEGENSIVTIAIYEGKKRQVRKMCEAVGHQVLDLTRVAIAKIELGDLKEGDLREYPKEEIYKLLFE